MIAHLPRRVRSPLAVVPRLFIALLGLPHTTHAAPCAQESLTPVCMVSSSITAARDSAQDARRHLPHDDRVDPTLAPDVLTRRRAQAFDAQCWAVGAPVVMVTGGVLYAVAASARGDHDGTTLGGAVAVSGVMLGPSVGWVRAGYWDHAASSMGLRVGTMVGALVMAGAIAGSTGLSGDAGLGVGLICATAGATAITVEMVLDVRHIGRHVRAHGPASEARVAFLTTHGPGLAVTLPLH